ncbi:MAG: PQQ-binding-like beta-propeller repeat protein [Candidatus Brocadiia bacterium]
MSPVRRFLHLLVFLGSVALGGQGAGRLIALDEPGWPQFRGPRRDAICRETGLLEWWPEGGPAVLWERGDIGRGYSSPTIVRDTLYITGDVGDDLVIFAFDLAAGGDDEASAPPVKWRTTNGRAWKRSHPGARATCTYAGGRLYHMNAHGRVACLEAATGKELWAVDVLERFEGRNIQWGLSECLLVDGERVMVTPGGKKALMAALDRDTGETLWTTPPLEFLRTYRFGGKEVDPPRRDVDAAGYASPVLFEMDGRRLLCRSAGQHIFCVDADSGTLVWKHKVYARFEVIGSMPVFCGDGVFFTASDEYGGHYFRVRVEGGAVRFAEAWETPVDDCHGSFVCVEGHIYGSGYRRFKPWVCLDVATGEMEYQKADLAIGAPLWADGRLYALSQRGRLALLEPTPGGFRTRGQFQFTRRRKADCWAHPVILDGRLYLRYHDRLVCYDVRATKGSVR